MKYQNYQNSMQQASFEKEITLEEAGTALKNRKNRKSPGTDGFGAKLF